mmetsp:Transcript_33180/g.56370  ORF Transcript_33180/g.56370 Transcript_33180/m.56370 type:complete len:279 (-) Transcript_33180:2560-3396(-)
MTLQSLSPSLAASSASPSTLDIPSKLPSFPSATPSTDLKMVAPVTTEGTPVEAAAASSCDAPESMRPLSVFLSSIFFKMSLMLDTMEESMEKASVAAAAASAAMSATATSSSAASSSAASSLPFDDVKVISPMRSVEPLLATSPFTARISSASASSIAWTHPSRVRPIASAMLPLPSASDKKDSSTLLPGDPSSAFALVALLAVTSALFSCNASVEMETSFDCVSSAVRGVSSGLSSGKAEAEDSANGWCFNHFCCLRRSRACTSGRKSFSPSPSYLS